MRVAERVRTVMDDELHPHACATLLGKRVRGSIMMKQAPDQWGHTLWWFLEMQSSMLQGLDSVPHSSCCSY
jgi:hypothetical protein